MFRLIYPLLAWLALLNAASPADLATYDLDEDGIISVEEEWKAGEKFYSILADTKLAGIYAHLRLTSYVNDVGKKLLATITPAPSIEARVAITDAGPLFVALPLGVLPGGLILLIASC